MIIKMQHYVPRFYLKNFSIQESSGKHIINCFDKIEGKVFKTDIRNVAGEKFFHDLERDKEQKIELGLSKLERKFSRAVKRLIEHKKVNNISEYQKGMLSLFIAVQMERTKERRESLKDLVNQVYERLSKENLSNELRESLEDAKKEKSIKLMHLQGLIEWSERFANIIFNLKWILFINKTKIPFMASDNPINLNNELTKNELGTIGLTCPGISIHVPISPFLCLVVCDPVAYSDLPDRFEVDNKENVIFENGLQILGSTRHVFSVGDDFSLVEKIIEKNPRHKNPNRTRINLR